MILSTSKCDPSQFLSRGTGAPHMVELHSQRHISSSSLETPWALIHFLCKTYKRTQIRDYISQGSIPGYSLSMVVIHSRVHSHRCISLVTSGKVILYVNVIDGKLAMTESIMTRSQSVSFGWNWLASQAVKAGLIYPRDFGTDTPMIVCTETHFTFKYF